LYFFISHDQSDQFNFKLDWKTRKVSKMSNKNEQKKIMEDLKLAESEAKKKAKEAEELKKKAEEIENEFKLRSEEFRKFENESKLRAEEFQKFENESKLRAEELKKKAEEIENEFKLNTKVAEEIREISKQFEGLDESDPGQIEDLKTSESDEESYSHRVLSVDYSESHSEELGDNFTFSSVSSDSETQEHLSSKEERENKSE
jgi:hypothetical protein